MLLKSGVKFNS